MGKAAMMIFTKEEMKRITEKIKEDGEKLISVDLHGLTVKAAKRLLMNLIAIDREGLSLNVIHGYSHGIEIKKMITGGGLNSPKITGIHPLPYNPGETVLSIAAA